MLSLTKTAAICSNNRQAVWQDVVRKLSSCRNCSPIAKELASEPKRWIDLVPIEWVEIYGALYDESSSFELSDHEIDKIEKDVFRTYSLFIRNAARMHIDPLMNLDEYYKGLRRVLYAASHTAGGYCQGINFIAAAFLLGTGNNEKESFTILCYLLKQRNYEVLFSPKYSSLVEYMKMFEKRLRKQNKEIYNHFQLHGFSTVCYAIEWFTTMFIVTSPGDLSSCSIDLVLIGMEDALIRVGLAVLDSLGPKILKLSQEDLQINFKQLVMDLDVATVLTLSFSMPVRLGQNMLGTMALNIQRNMPENGLHINTLLSSKSSRNISCDQGDEKISSGDDTTVCNFQVNTFLFSDYSNKGDDDEYIRLKVAKELYENSFNSRHQKSLRQIRKERLKTKKEVFLKKLRLLIARTEFLSSNEYKIKCKNDPNNYPLKVPKKSVIGYISDDGNKFEMSNSNSVDAVHIIGNVLGFGLFNAFDAIPSVNMLSGDKSVLEFNSSKKSSSSEIESGSAKEVKVVVGKEVENSRMLGSIVGGIDNVVSASLWFGTLGLVGSKSVENNDNIEKHNDSITDDEYFGDIDSVNENQSTEEMIHKENLNLFPIDKKLTAFSDIVAQTNHISNKKSDDETCPRPAPDSRSPIRSVSQTDMPTIAPRNIFHPRPFVQPTSSYLSHGTRPLNSLIGIPRPRGFIPMHPMHGPPRHGPPRHGPPRHGPPRHGSPELGPQREYDGAINHTNFESKGKKSYNKSGRIKPKILYANI